MVCTRSRCIRHQRSKSTNATAPLSIVTRTAASSTPPGATQLKARTTSGYAGKNATDDCSCGWKVYPCCAICRYQPPSHHSQLPNNQSRVMCGRRGAGPCDQILGAKATNNVITTASEAY